ncbi:MAG: hypothetical protein QXN26_00635 [Thermoplasmataceae archaeon]
MTREIKTINGKQYAYEVSMFWDSEHRKRHKVSKYAGKIINGDRTIMAEIPKRVRELAEILDLKPELFPEWFRVKGSGTGDEGHILQ